MRVVLFQIVQDFLGGKGLEVVHLLTQIGGLQDTVHMILAPTEAAKKLR